MIFFKQYIYIYIYIYSVCVCVCVRVCVCTKFGGSLTEYERENRYFKYCSRKTSFFLCRLAHYDLHASIWPSTRKNKLSLVYISYV